MLAAMAELRTQDKCGYLAFVIVRCTVALLNGNELAEVLREAAPRSSRVRLAVAFWGKGAIDGLGLEKARDLHVLCNLRMGGTNPKVVRSLMASGAVVRQSDTLHAKLYLLDYIGAVGSSNASSNGLSMQATECAAWDELNITFGPGDLYGEAERAFDGLWKSGREVTEEDLKQAEYAWRTKRRAAPFGAMTAKTLLDLARENPEQVADRSIYVVVAGSNLSAAAADVRTAEQQRSGRGDNVDGFEDWPQLPDNAEMICFYRGRRGGIRFDGLWETPKERQTLPVGEEGEFLLCYRRQSIRGVKRAGPMLEWQAAINRAHQDQGDDSFCIEFGNFARKYLG